MNRFRIIDRRTGCVYAGDSAQDGRPLFRIEHVDTHHTRFFGSYTEACEALRVILRKGPGRNVEQLEVDQVTP